MTESQWRFLSAIAERVPTERIVELRLFPVIRQGGMESGAAVVAVEEIVAPPEGEVAADGLSGEAAGSGVAASDGSPTNAEIEIDLGPLFEPPVAAEASEHGESSPDARAIDVGDDDEESPYRSDVVAGGSSGKSREESAAASDREIASATFDAAAPADLSAVPDASDSESNPDDVDGASEPPARPQVKRYSVLAARYRLTLKGPERGAWDFEITHEADAPLDTVERVARGVARRSGDEGQPEHLTASDIRATLAQPWWSGAS